MTLSAGASGADSKPVCDEIEAFRRASSNSRQLLNRISKTYPSCATWLAKSCLSAFRLDAPASDPGLIGAKSTADCPTCMQDPPGPLSSSATHTLSSVADQLSLNKKREVKAYQARLAEEALLSWERLNRKRNEDLKEILSLYKRAKLPMEISPEETRAAISTLVARVTSASQNAPSAEKRDWNKFVADQIADAGNDTKTEWTDASGKHTDIDPGFYSRLAKEKNDRDRFSEMVSRAKKNDSGSAEEFDGNLTPYHSKMILLYHLENKLLEKDPKNAEAKLDRLAQRLFLKANFKAKGPATWRQIIPHDGFALGANAAQYRNLTSPNAEKSAYLSPGTGVDCATFAQMTLEGMGYREMKKIGRLTSFGIANGKLGEISTVVPLTAKNAGTPSPGDLIVKRERGDPVGHVEIVVGYEGNPPGLSVVSAEGGYQRGVIKRRLDLFPKSPQDCERETDFTKNPDHKYFRASLKRGPHP